MEADLVKRAGLPYRLIPAAGVHGISMREMPGNLLRLSRGVLTSRRILRGFRPDVLFFTGGYVAVPMAFAGRRIQHCCTFRISNPGWRSNPWRASQTGSP
jgi:UDP-N-acetylglucosamine--N-acetylmuramyl-(pentapeptide) pyrophosphoryl-undecaprenol N-acetylglucosamine transferase